MFFPLVIFNLIFFREFVRLGKWFVQPFDGTERPKAPPASASHLSFSFSYFIHGESAVCASVDVREHAPVRRLNHEHMATASSLATTVQVIYLGLINLDFFCNWSNIAKTNQLKNLQDVYIHVVFVQTHI